MSVSLPDWIERVRAGEPAHEPRDPSAAVEPLCEAANEVVRHDIEGARRLADEALRLSGSSESARLKGFAWRCDAILLWSMNRFPEALASFEKALEQFEAAGEAVEAARTRSNAIQTLIYLSKPEVAMRWAQQAREVFVRLDEPLRLARLEGNIANLLYRQDRFEEALELYESIEHRFREFGQPRDVASVLRNKAVCHLSLSRFDDALRTHREAREFCLAKGMIRLVAETDYNIAYLHFLRGDYLYARELYAAARRAASESSDGYHLALCDLDESELLIELNLHQDGEELAARAVKEFHELKLQYEEAKARVFLALCAGQQGDLRRALRVLRAARRQFVREQSALWPPLIDLYAALLLEKSGELAAARRRGRAALGFFAPAILPGKAIHCRLLLARIELQLGNTAAASAHVLAAERILPQAQSPALAGHTWAMRGRLHEALDHHDDARVCYLRAEQEFECLRDRLRTEEMRISFFQDKASVYESHFRLLIEREQFAEALAIAERAKSRNLSTLAQPRRHPVAGLGGNRQTVELREQLEQLYSELDAAELERSPLTSTRAGSIRKRIAHAETELRRQLSGRHSGLAELAVPQIEEILAGLPGGARLIEYFCAHGEFHAIVVGGGRIVARRTGSAAQLTRLLRFLQFHLSGVRAQVSGADARSLAHVTEHLQELYRELIAPLAGDLAGAEHCVVVPHGPLHGLPFHALHDGAAFLGERMTFSYAPSSAVLLRTLRAPLAQAMAPAVFGIADSGTPEIPRECETVADTLPGCRLYLNEEATLQRLRRTGVSARILHIATHGRFRRDNPWFSAIHFGDGYLNLYDIYELRIAAHLVVLSGCSTGSSVVLGGDESVGLARGLLHAGATSAVLSLWDVNDASTALFMKHFYGGLAAGIETQTALQAAQSAVRERFPHPYFWAPFVLTGRFGGIVQKC